MEITNLTSYRTLSHKGGGRVPLSLKLHSTDHQGEEFRGLVSRGQNTHHKLRIYICCILEILVMQLLQQTLIAKSVTIDFSWET